MLNKTCDSSILKPIIGNRLHFRCHRDIKCFNKCCADLNLLLTPYDILRITGHLKISTDDFLDDFTDTRIDERSRFPMVYLQMKDDGNKPCPFVSRDGCTIYEHRPGACRIYPLGRATAKPDSQRDLTEQFFTVNETHCLGFNEDVEWTIDEWVENEGLKEYNEINDQWMEIITSQKSLGNEDAFRKKMQMFYMASYNLDKFKNFLFKSSFFNLFDVDPTQRIKMETDNRELLKFSFCWLKFSLFGEKTLTLKADSQTPARS